MASCNNEFLKSSHILVLKTHLSVSFPEALRYFSVTLHSAGRPQRYCGFVPDHCSKVSHNKASCNPFAGGGSCLRFVKNTISVKSNKVKHSTMRFASSWAEKLLFLVCFKKLYLKP